MKITYDREADALYISFRSTKAELLTKHVTDDIAFDYDEKDRLAGIEILDASRVLADPALLEQVQFEVQGEQRARR